MSIIDFHTHAFPDTLAPRAIAKLSASANWPAVSGGTVTELLRSMDDNGIDVSVVCPIATKPGQADGIFQWCQGIRSDRIVPLPSVHPEDAKPREWIRQFAKEGYRGIKLHPMYQTFAADDEHLAPIYDAAAEHELFVVSHCGFDMAFAPDDDRAAPQRFRRVIDRFPELVMICTHMGGWRAWDQVETHLLGTRVYLETSLSLHEIGPERSADLIQRHGVDRVLLGSDWPWQTQLEAIALIRGLPLSPADQEKILAANAADLLL